MSDIAVDLPLGSPLPSFSLPDTEGGTESAPLDDAPPVTVVIFTCNHCPYVVAWNPRIRAVAEEYQSRGVRFLQISSNDETKYPADSYQHMQEFFRNQSWPFPYLYDESQEVARDFGAQTTPHVFVFDGEQKLRYRGAPDGDHSDKSQNAVWLRDALDDLLAGKPVENAETPPRGCSIKWRD
jgi:peroxiredoxin